jgi:hypothetical protein
MQTGGQLGHVMTGFITQEESQLRGEEDGRPRGPLALPAIINGAHGQLDCNFSTSITGTKHPAPDSKTSRPDSYTYRLDSKTSELDSHADWPESKTSGLRLIDKVIRHQELTANLPASGEDIRARL